ncbi:hypothetical protein WMY93_017895 [Mugilogobius chulae]|uniref:Uncharacterized protein n=1 Tax=Mugilogobius chulae TaxID=88201 RepID=A0AAW0NU58_9GOBI
MCAWRPLAKAHGSKWSQRFEPGYAACFRRMLNAESVLVKAGRLRKLQQQRESSSTARSTCRLITPKYVGQRWSWAWSWSSQRHENSLRAGHKRHENWVSEATQEHENWAVSEGYVLTETPELSEGWTQETRELWKADVSQRHEKRQEGGTHVERRQGKEEIDEVKETHIGFEDMRRREAKETRREEKRKGGEKEGQKTRRKKEKKEIRSKGRKQALL